MEEVELEIVPVGIQIDNQFFREGIDITPEEFYSAAERKGNIPTSQAGTGDFLAVYNRLVGKAREIISIHITSNRENNRSAGQLGNIYHTVTVVDSESEAWDRDFWPALPSKRSWARAGKRFWEIIKRLKEKITVFVAVPTLKYLAAVRVSRVQAMLSSLLTIKPILGVKDGLVPGALTSAPMVRHYKRILTLVEERFPTDRLRIAVLHSNALEMAEELKQKVEERWRCA